MTGDIELAAIVIGAALIVAALIVGVALVAAAKQLRKRE
jgi:hypothetical protein